MNVNALSQKYDNIVDCIKTPVELTNPLNKSKLTCGGIWDTGANKSAITKESAKNLGLIPLSKGLVRGVHGIQEVNVYNIGITLNNKNISVIAQVTECDALSQDNSVGLLIGMNIINMGDFSISNHNGKTVMSYRVPSVENIDYVEEISEYNKTLKIHEQWSKNGNEKCPCGSGKLYKNCHGKSKYSL